VSAPDPTMCLYHFPCLDGFTAAWAVWRKYGDKIAYIPCNYGEPTPDVKGEHVLIVDYSFEGPVLEKMLQDAASITILDHHKTAEEDLTPFLEDGRIQGKFDMHKSGASMAWEHCHPNDARPFMIMYVEDYDLWRLNHPDTRAIKALLTSYDYDMQTWSDLAAMIEDPISVQEVVRQGQAIDRAQLKNITEMLQQGVRPIRLGGYTVSCCNLPYMWASDGAGLLAESAAFGVGYCDKKSVRMFSLRSRGEDAVDVSEIARKYGGGGHRGAAGFEAPLNWLGD